jgi:hypothetical protein
MLSMEVAEKVQDPDSHTLKTRPWRRHTTPFSDYLKRVRDLISQALRANTEIEIAKIGLCARTIEAPAQSRIPSW